MTRSNVHELTPSPREDDRAAVWPLPVLRVG